MWSLSWTSKLEKEIYSKVLASKSQIKIPIVQNIGTQ